MKKKFLKVLSFVFGAAFLLTGCATVSNVKNTSSEIIYYGGSAVTVGDYTYFANGYTAYEDAKTFDYAGKSKVSYLARINNKEVEFTDGKDYSPNNVDKVVEKVTGYQNQDMFVLGNYIYYTSTNLHKDKTLTNDYSLVTFWRTKLNGDKVKELFTTEYFGDSSKFAPVGNEQNGYYWVCYTGKYSEEQEGSGEILSIKLGNSCGKVVKIAEKVSSCAFSNVNEDGSYNKIIYTTTEEVGTSSKNAIYAVDYDGKNKTSFDDNENNVVLVDKIRDTVFYTSDQNSSVTFFKDLKNVADGELFENNQKIFVYNSSIKNIHAISEGDADEGFVYVGTSSSSLMYAKLTNTTRPTTLVSGDGFSDLLFVEGDRVYFSSSTKIARVSIKPLPATNEIEAEELASMADIQSGKYGFDGKYVYFFAKLEGEKAESSESEDEKEDKDENYYMYRVAKGGGDYQLIGKTIKERTPEKEEE